MDRIIILFTCLTLAVSCQKRASDAKSGKSQSLTQQSSSKRKVLQNKGSDTLVNVAQAWAEAYAKVNPNLAIAVTGGGSGTGISAMINGTVDIANASRKMKDKEIELAKKNGINPVEHTVGYDALAVFVHKNNPMTEASIAQLAGIYGEGGSRDKWSQLNVKVPGCGSDEIVRVSRQNNSGTYAYFKEAVLGKTNEYKLGSRDMHGSKDVVDLVEKTPCAIGYSGLAYATDHVKMLCIKKQESDTCVAPSVESAIDQTYPIARPLFMYTSGTPKGEIKMYLDWILSDKGQCIIKQKGYAPVKKVTCN
jgi:phosphate transport system substrate-binding protein